MKNISNTFCAYPFSRVIYRGYDPARSKADAVPCCFVDPLIIRETQITEDIINQSPAWNELQESMLKGERHPACAKCWRDEDLGINSPRQKSLVECEPFIKSKRIYDTKLRFLEIIFGNTCNQACRMCNSFASSRLERIDEILHEKNIIKHTPIKHKYPIWQTIDLLNIEYLQIMGGEPILQKEALDMMEYLLEQGVLKNLRFYLVTNCSRYINDRWKKILLEAKEVGITLSIDGIGKLNEYIRVGSEWSQVEENLLKYQTLANEHPHIQLAINTTITVLNANKSREIKRYFNKLGIQSGQYPAINPKFMSVDCLPAHLKKKILRKFPVREVSLTLEDTTDESFDECKKAIQVLDDHYKTSFEEVNPEMYEWIFK